MLDLCHLGGGGGGMGGLKPCTTWKKYIVLVNKLLLGWVQPLYLCYKTNTYIFVFCLFVFFFIYYTINKSKKGL